MIFSPPRSEIFSVSVPRAVSQLRTRANAQLALVHGFTLHQHFIFHCRFNSRLAHKSSSKSAKRDRAPCLEARSAKRDRRSSSERARSASERELDLFPLLEIESSDVILARTFQGAKLSQGTQAVKITFRVSYNGFKAALVLRWPTKTFSFVFHYVEGYFRDRLKLKYVKIWSFYLAITLRWCSRTSLYFAFSTHTRLRRSMDA